MADSRTRDLVLAPAQPDDAIRIATLSRDLIEAGLAWSWTTDRVTKSIAHPETVVLTASHHGNLIGFAIMEFGMTSAHLSLLAVSEPCQRQGIGRRLFEWLRKSALTAGIGEIKVEMRANNAAARKFYGRLGFLEIGLVAGYYQRREDALRMKVNLLVR